jgi:nitrogen fixation-related uncharacterized protein
MIEKALIFAFAIIYGLFCAFRSGKDTGEQKAKNKSLTDTITENEKTKKSQTEFNDLSDADKSSWLLRDMEKRNKDSKRFLR